MTTTRDYGQLHRAVDRLNPAQADALYVIVESMLGEHGPAGPTATSEDRAASGHHRLSFTSAGHGPADLAERAEDYLREATLRAAGP